MELASRRILIVDEDPIGRRVVASAVAGWGADVVEAATVSQAGRIDGAMDAVVLSLPLSVTAWPPLFEQILSRWPGVCLIGSTVLTLERIPWTYSEHAALLAKPISLRELRANLDARFRKLA